MICHDSGSIIPLRLLLLPPMMDFTSSTDYEPMSCLSTSTSWGYTPTHVSEFDVQAILFSENRVPVTLLWSTGIVEGPNFLLCYHSRCIQIKPREAPKAALDFHITVDNERVTSEWVVISEKSQIQIGESHWRLEIPQVSIPRDAQALMANNCYPSRSRD